LIDKNGYRRRIFTSKTAKIHRFVRAKSLIFDVFSLVATQP